MNTNKHKNIKTQKPIHPHAWGSVPKPFLTPVGLGFRVPSLLFITEPVAFLNLKTFTPVFYFVYRN